MAGQITDMTAAASLALTDLMEVTVDPGGTPLTRKATLEQQRARLLAALGGIAPVAVTAAATATIDRFHLCTGTSANYELALPAASGLGGHFVGVLMGIPSALTKLVTLNANSSEKIDDALLRPMWALETALLYCDGSNWSKVSGKTIPMAAVADRAAAQSIASGAYAKILLDTTRWSYGPGLVDIGNSKFVLQRSGRYQVSNFGRLDIAVSTNVVAGVFVNGSEAFRGETTSAVTQSATASQPIDGVAADEIDLRIYNGGLGSESTNSAAGVQPRLAITEIPSW